MAFFILVFLFCLIAFPAVAITGIIKYGFAVAWDEFRVAMVASIICIPILIITIATFLDSLKEKEDIKKYNLEKEEKLQQEKKKMVYFVCPKCAHMTSGLPDNDLECPYCCTMTTNTGINKCELEEEISKGKKMCFDEFESILKKYVYNNPLYDNKKVEERIKIINAEETERLENEKRIQEQRAFERYLDETSSLNQGIKCPVCGSHYVVKIGALNRAASVHFWGLASSKIGKQYECKDCHHKF